MIKLNLLDKNFITWDKSSCHLAENKYIEWITESIVSNSCFITDQCLVSVSKLSHTKRKIAWILEPRSIYPDVYHWIAQNNRLFDYVLTYDQTLIDRGENFLYYPHGRCWIHDYKEEPKDQLCSIFASTKAYTIGHRLRHEVIKQYPTITAFGHSVNNYIEKKEDGLNNFMFSVTIENAIMPGYWTEKIVDCFATKTIPIFYGDKSVCKFFAEDGIIFFNTIKELKEILPTLTPEVYKKKLPAIEYNFSLVEKYRVPEDWIYSNYPFLCN
jgi:hypothetical protein